MTAFTRTTITNLALREIGDYRVDDYTEDSPAASVANDLWDQVRLVTLQAHEWQFAKTQALLADAGTPTARYDTAWALPADLVRLASVSEFDTMQPELMDFVVMGRQLLSSTDYIYIEYIYDAPAIADWPAYFVHYFTAVLASEMASPLKSTTERERLEQLITARLGNARRLDSQFSPTMQLPASNWLWAMRGLRRNGFGTR